MSVFRSSINQRNARSKLLHQVERPDRLVTLFSIYRHSSRTYSSVSRSSRLMLNIMTSSPMVTTISNANPNHPNTIAVVPTPLFTLPLPRSCAIVLAATEAVCCHNTETSTKTEATKISARAICDTGREGKGFTSRSDPLSSVSSCQPGKVARSRKHMKARTIATILRVWLVTGSG